MHRDNLLVKLDTYEEKHPEDRDIVNSFRDFMQSHSDCFYREQQKGHITGSCLLLSPDKEKLLLTHHKKLNMWIQLGGHSDGNPDSLDVALREAEEESGITKVSPISEEIFSIDVHEIPGRKNEPKHLHFDVTYLLLAESENYQVSDESHDLKWLRVDELVKMPLDGSLRNMVHRLHDELQKIKN